MKKTMEFQDVQLNNIIISSFNSMVTRNVHNAPNRTALNSSSMKMWRMSSGDYFIYFVLSPISWLYDIDYALILCIDREKSIQVWEKYTKKIKKTFIAMIIM